MVDPVWAAVAVGLSGFALWVVTQFQILRAIRLIKADIDGKRKTTQEFVDERLGKVEAAMGSMEGRLRAEIPANADVTSMREDMEAFHQEFVDFGAQIGKDLNDLPMKLHLRLANERSIDVKQFQAELSNQTEGAEKALSMADAMATNDPEFIRNMMIQKIANASVTTKYAKEHPVQAAIVEAVKYKMMEAFGALPSSSPSVSMRRLSPGGFQER